MHPDHWYIGCPSVKLETKPLATKVLDQEIVLFRDSNGKPVALADRCCHRGYQLSCGKVVGDRVECGFHGWQYNASGKCELIPSLRAGQEIKDIYRIKSYPCVEKDSYVWVWPGETSPTYSPSVPFFEEGKWTQGQALMNCNAMRAVEINLDSCHVRYIHPTHPYTLEVMQNGGKFNQTEQEIRVTDSGMVLFWPATKSPADPIPKTDFIAFDLPDRVLLGSSVPNMGTVYLVFYFVPTGENSCRMEYLATQFDPTAKQKVTFVNEIFQILDEDKRVLENIQKMYDLHGPAFEKSVEADAAPLLARQIAKLAEKGKWPSDRSALSPRRILTLNM